MEETKITGSYQSMRRYILDLHIWLVVTLGVAYLFEPIEGYLMIKQIIGLWLITILMWLLLRIVDFLKKNDKENAIKEEEKRCAAQVELSRETEKLLVEYAYENDLSISEIVELALGEYVKKYQHLLEKNDEES